MAKAVAPEAVTVDARELGVAVRWVAALVPGPVARAADACVSLRASTGVLTVAGGIVQRGWRWMAFEGEGSWACTVRPATLSRLARVLKTGRVALQSSGGRLTLSFGAGRVVLDAEPETGTEEAGERPTRWISVEAARLCEMFRRGLAVVATCESRPSLYGIDLAIDEGSFRAQATDGHRVVVATLPTAGEIGAWKGDADRNAVRQILAACPTFGAVELGVTDHHIWLKGEGRLFKGGRLRAPFPGEAVAKAVNDSRDRKAGCVHLKRAALAESTRALLAVVGKNRYAGCVVSFSEGTMRVAVDGDDGAAFDAAVGCERCAGSLTTFGINARFLATAIAGCTTDEVRIAVTGPQDPVWIGDVGDRSRVEAVVMPMRLEGCSGK